MSLCGIFGGTFNPPHQGHVNLCHQLLACTPLTDIHWLPCFQPVHKANTLDAHHRHAMLSLICQSHPHFHLNDWEMTQQRALYSLTTIRHLKSTYPTHPWVWIIGSDQDLTTWHAWETLLTLISWIVVPREKPLASALSAYLTADVHDLNQPGAIWMAPIETPAISSSMIREDFSTHQNAIPEVVKPYITQHQLYDA